MKALITFFPKLLNTVKDVFVKSKEWNTKKKVAVLVSVPVSLIIFTLVLKYAGVENAEAAASLIIMTLEAVLEAL